MTNWDDALREAPELGRLVQDRFEATGLGILATLRRDGSPRVSGIEPFFWNGGVWIGSMWEAAKARDLQRDPRLALHSATVDKEVKEGDARIAARAVEVVDPTEKAAFSKAFAAEHEFDPEASGPWHLFGLDITGLSAIRTGEGHLVIDVWHPGEAPRRIERS